MWRESEIEVADQALHQNLGRRPFRRAPVGAPHEGEEALLVEVVHGGRLGVDERIVEPLVFVPGERAVQVIALAVPLQMVADKDWDGP